MDPLTVALKLVPQLAAFVGHGSKALLEGGGKAEREPLFSKEPALVLYAGFWGWMYNKQVLEQHRIVVEQYRIKKREHTIRIIVTSVLLTVILVSVCQVIVSLQVLSGWSSQLTQLVVLAT